MPSIMPDGAIMWAPARAWLLACSTRSGRVASLSTSMRPPISASGPQCPWSVYSQKQRSVITRRSGAISPGEADGLLNDAVVAGGGRAAGVFVLGDTEEDDRRDAQLGDLGEGFAQPVERKLILTRHRRDLAPEVSCRDRRTGGRSGH